MKQTRKCVFETNSSSSHSLTVAPGDLVAMPFCKETARNGVVDIGMGDYGWEWARIYSTEGKLAYLVTQIFGNVGTLPDGNPEQVTRDAREDYPDFDMLCRVVEQHTGVAIRLVPGSCGYVDHDSEGVGMDVLRSPEQLRQFLFNSDSYIQTGNDNSGPPLKMHTDTRGIEYTYGAHYREPGKDYVQVELYRSGEDLDNPYATAAGASLADYVEVLQKLREYATVTNVHVVEQAPWSVFAHENPVPRTMEKLSDPEGANLKFSAQLRVDVALTKIPFSRLSESVYFETTTLRVPPELAAELAGLVPVAHDDVTKAKEGA